MKVTFEVDTPDDARILMDAHNMHSVLFDIKYNVYRKFSKEEYSTLIDTNQLDGVAKVLSVINAMIEEKNITLG